MKKKIGTILNYLIIIASLALVLYYTLEGDSLQTSVAALRSVHPSWLILCFAGAFGFVGFDAISVWFFLRRQGYRLSLGYCFYTSFIGQFYCYVTPGATGGQPMQVYYLHKRGIPVGLSSSALILRLFSLQLSLSLFATVLWIMNGPFIAEQVGGSMWFLVIGYVYNLIVITLLLLVALQRGIIRFFLKWGVKIGAKLHLIKNPEQSMAKAQKAVDGFHDSAKLALKNPLDLAVLLVIGMLQLMSLMLVLWFIFVGMHQEGATFPQVLSMNVMEYISACYMPTPGASGAQEITFNTYFGTHMFDEEHIMPALLMWRFFTYYLTLIFGVLLLVVGGWITGKKPPKVSDASIEEMSAEDSRNTTEAPAAETAE